MSDRHDSIEQGLAFIRSEVKRTQSNRPLCRLWTEVLKHAEELVRRERAFDEALVATKPMREKELDAERVDSETMNFRMRDLGNQVGEWRLIDTAPKDRTRVLLATPVSGVAIGYFDATRNLWASDGSGVFGSHPPFHSHPGMNNIPTHWRPLPEHPLGPRPQWTCRARKTTDPVQDCGWPTCGCDPWAL